MRRKLFFIILFFIDLGNYFSTAASSPSVHVMTYNIRYANTIDTGSISWMNRRDFIRSTILFHKADIVCMQEVLHQQLVFFDSTLVDFSHVGVGREDGKEKGEYAPVFYNHNFFERLTDSTFWLSSSPDRVSKGWDAALERICTWVKLKDKRSGKIFFVFNTHFDHQGEQARTESAKLLLEKIKRIAQNNPVILCGDFNTAENTEPINIIKGKNEQNHLLTDAMYSSKLPHHGSYKTFCGFNVLKGVIGDRIDYVFVTKQFYVLTHATLTDFKEEHFPSDHFPVFSEMILN